MASPNPTRKTSIGKLDELRQELFYPDELFNTEPWEIAPKLYHPHELSTTEPWEPAGVTEPSKGYDSD